MADRDDTTIRLYLSTRDELVDVRRDLSVHRNETLLSHDAAIMALIDEWRKRWAGISGETPPEPTNPNVLPASARRRSASVQARLFGSTDGAV